MSCTVAPERMVDSRGVTPTLKTPRQPAHNTRSDELSRAVPPTPSHDAVKSIPANAAASATR